MEITQKTWNRYISRLRQLNEAAASQMEKYIETHDITTEDGIQNAIDVAYALSTKYGEGAAALSCEMYDAVATLSGKNVPPAEPAETATYDEAAKTVQGILKKSILPQSVGAGVGRMVKLAGVDTTLKNGMRDGAEFAWIPVGDTCPFCLMLASNGWRHISKKALKKGHAEHIHSNCDCTYAVRFNSNTDVAGYNPNKIMARFDGTDGNSWKEKMNTMRREQYEKSKEEKE